VTVAGDFGSDVGMHKGGDGIWSATVGPLDPEMYVYYFTLDGVRLTDPGSPGRHGAERCENPAPRARTGGDQAYVPGNGRGDHWRVWRRYLHDLAPLLFK
jgi:hypothetical protein